MNTKGPHAANDAAAAAEALRGVQDGRNATAQREASIGQLGDVDREAAVRATQAEFAKAHRGPTR